MANGTFYTHWKREGGLWRVRHGREEPPTHYFDFELRERARLRQMADEGMRLIAAGKSVQRGA